MAVQIQLKRGSSTPSAGSFAEGEPAWDSTNSKLYVKNAAGTMVLINPGNQDYGLVTGAVDGSTDYGSIV